MTVRPSPTAIYVCELGHRTPYAGSWQRVIRCPARIAQRTRCGAQARLQEA